MPIPGPDVVDLRTRSTPSRGPARRIAPPLLVPASNQWAVSARRGTRGALLANDPHLELRLPNIFYRTELEWPDGAVRGVSIPGVPGVLLGATSKLAWGATVSNADQADWVVIDVDAHDSSPLRHAGRQRAVSQRDVCDRGCGRRAGAARGREHALGSRRRARRPRQAARAARNVARRGTVSTSP